MFYWSASQRVFLAAGLIALLWLMVMWATAAQAGIS